MRSLFFVLLFGLFMGCNEKKVEKTNPKVSDLKAKKEIISRHYKVNINYSKDFKPSNSFHKIKIEDVTYSLYWDKSKDHYTCKTEGKYQKVLNCHGPKSLAKMDKDQERKEELKENEKERKKKLRELKAEQLKELKAKYLDNIGFLVSYGPIITELKDTLEQDKKLTHAISLMWQEALAKGLDFNQAVTLLHSSPAYEAEISDTKNSMNRIQAHLRKMKKHGSDAETSYGHLVDAYTKLEELHGLALKPSGNFDTYVKACESAYKETRALIKKAEIYAPDDVVDWDKLEDDKKAQLEKFY